LVSTVGYLEYKIHGAEGICAAFLRKLGVERNAAGPGSHFCTTSLRVLVWDSETQTIAYTPAAAVRWGTKEVSLVLEPDDATDGPLFNSLRGTDNSIIVGYQGNVAICKVANSTQVSGGGKNRWEISLNVERADFSPSMEMAFGNTSADQLAEMRGRRLLLNENPSKQTGDINDITREMFIAGQATIVRVKASPFPDLFKSYNTKRGTFLEVAWVHAATMLKLASVVEQIESFALTLRGHSLEVDFSGVRRKVYQNAPAYKIRIKGACRLSAET
jgi:hypothetical protein